MGQARQTEITARQFKGITRIQPHSIMTVSLRKGTVIAVLSYDMKPKEHVDETGKQKLSALRTLWHMKQNCCT